ncbi:MAG: hypothetical protein ACR2MD_17300 [Aridibacter sp.]
MICNYCWETVDELFSSEDDICLECHRKLTHPMFSDEVGISFSQVRWAVSESNKKNRRIAELEDENLKLKSTLTSKNKIYSFSYFLLKR